MKKRLALLVSALLACQAFAYQVTLPIQHRSKGSLQTGIRQGATKLILRLTAQQSAVDALADEIQNAQHWVDQYSTTHRPGNADYPWLLDVAYSKQHIQQLLDQHHLPYWKQAPTPVSVLLKTAADKPISESDPRWIALDKAAKVRGYTLNHLDHAPTELTQNDAPLEFIMVTMPDAGAGSPGQAGGRSVGDGGRSVGDGGRSVGDGGQNVGAAGQNVGDAGQNVGAEELNADIESLNAETEAEYHVENSGIHWSWYHQGEWQQWQQEPSEQWAEQAAEIIGAQLVQTQPRQTTNNLTPIHITINGVSDFSDYTQAIQTLKQLHNVQSMIDDGIKNDQLSITMIADVPVFDLKQSLDDVQQLTPLTNSSQAGSEADLRYYWGVPPVVTQAPVIKHVITPAAEPTVDEQAFPYDNAAKDDAQGLMESLPPQD